MSDTQEEQTRWLVDYLETRLDKLESRIDASLQRTEDKLAESLDKLTERLEGTEARIDQVELDLQKLQSQAGFVKNLLAFVGTAVLSLLGWAASTFFQSPPGK
jgi:Uri superfamily endonuclease